MRDIVYVKPPNSIASKFNSARKNRNHVSGQFSYSDKQSTTRLQASSPSSNTTPTSSVDGSPERGYILSEDSQDDWANAQLQISLNAKEAQWKPEEFDYEADPFQPITFNGELKAATNDRSTLQPPTEPTLESMIQSKYQLPPQPTFESKWPRSADESSPATPTREKAYGLADLIADASIADEFWSFNKYDSSIPTLEAKPKKPWPQEARERIPERWRPIRQMKNPQEWWPSIKVVPAARPDPDKMSSWDRAVYRSREKLRAKNASLRNVSLAQQSVPSESTASNPTDQPASQPFTQFIIMPSNPSASFYATRSAAQSTTQSATQPATQSAIQSATQSAQSTTRSATQPATEPATHSATEPTIEPATQPSKPIAEAESTDPKLNPPVGSYMYYKWGTMKMVGYTHPDQLPDDPDDPFFLAWAASNPDLVSDQAIQINRTPMKTPTCSIKTEAAFAIDTIPTPPSQYTSTQPTSLSKQTSTMPTTPSKKATSEPVAISETISEAKQATETQAHSGAACIGRDASGRRVSKARTWQEAQKQYAKAEFILRQREGDLVLCDNSYCFDNRWYNACPEIGDPLRQSTEDLVNYRNAPLPVSKVFFEQLPINCLQRLKISQITIAQLMSLNQMQCLRVLEIDALSSSDSELHLVEPQKPFSLHSLQTLCIKEFDSELRERACVQFDTPSLKTTCFGNSVVSHVHFSSFESIKHLKFDLDPDHQALQYTHLTVLICNEILANQNQFTRPNRQRTEFHALRLLAELPSLKEVHFHVKGLTDLTKSDVTSANYDQLETFFDSLSATLPASRDADLRVYLEGRQMQEDQKFCIYRFMASPFKWQYYQYKWALQSTGKLDKDNVAPSFTKVDFNVFRKSVRPEDLSNALYMRRFSCRYPNIQKVTLSRELKDLPFNRQSVVVFLQNLRNVSWLDCHQTELGTEFYEFYLSSFASLRESLTVLHLNESTHDRTYATLDFSFLKAFRQLRYFSTNLCHRMKAYDVWCQFDYSPVMLVFHFVRNHKKTYSLKLSTCLDLQGRHEYRMYIHGLDANEWNLCVRYKTRKANPVVCRTRKIDQVRDKLKTNYQTKEFLAHPFDPEDWEVAGYEALNRLTDQMCREDVFGICLYQNEIRDFTPLNYEWL